MWKKKPKVGYEFRYRISKYLDSLNNKQSNSLITKSNEQENIIDGFYIGNFLINKNKIGIIGSDYKYRATNKIVSLLFGNDLKKYNQLILQCFFILIAIFYNVI